MSAAAGVLQSVGNFATQNAAQIGTSISSLAGTFAKSEAEKQAGEEREAAFNMNAALLDRQAGEVEGEGEREAEITKRKLKRLMSKQRSLYAKAGVDLSTGSPLSVLVATAAESEKELQTVKRGTRREARGLRERAGLQRFYGRQSRSASRTRAKTTLLSGLGTTFSNFARENP